MPVTELRTRQLRLVPASVEHLRAELAGDDSFSQLLRAQVPPSWPPGEYDVDAQRYFLDCLESAGDDGVGWYGWYAVRPADDLTPCTLVAGGGYFGPPAADGIVEIGYSVCPESRRRGYATEIATVLAAHASRLPGVTLVIAHTTLDNPGSVAVLERSGFVAVGAGTETDTIRFEYALADTPQRPMVSEVQSA